MNVLLATDGSPSSLMAERFVEKFPFAEPCHLTLASCTPVPDLHGLMSAVPPQIHAIVEEARTTAERRLAEAAERCRPWAASVSTALLAGHPAEELLRAAEAHGAGLIVCGARGLTASQRFVLGSVSDRVARHAPCSVLIVRTAGDEPEAYEAPLRRVLVADDNSPCSERAVRRLAQWQPHPEISISVVRVLTLLAMLRLEAETPYQERVIRERRLAQEHLQRIVAQLQAVTKAIDVHLAEAEHAGHEIVRQAEELRADLIVLGSRGRTGLRRLLLGSTSLHVLHHSHCSVWIERGEPGCT
jgi:nucleotide-binding universal stress UspA family protein